MDQTDVLPLRQRVIRSAHGLACSTFSGVASVEAGLRDPRAPGKQQVQRRRRNHEAPTADALRKRRHSRTANAGASSFRSVRQDDRAREAEREFERFYHEVPQDFGGVGLSRKSLVHAERFDESQGASSFDRPQTWHLATNDKLQHEDTTADQTSDAVSSEVLWGMNVRQNLRSSAIERLDQLQQQIGLTALASIREVHQGPVRREYRHRDCGRIPRYTRVDKQPVATLRQQGIELPSTPAEDERPTREFHCPYIECHFNLVAQNARASPSEQRRRCVHSCCDYVSETAQNWLEHATTPHHDLQAPVRESGEDSSIGPTEDL